VAASGGRRGDKGSSSAMLEIWWRREGGRIEPRAHRVWRRPVAVAAATAAAAVAADRVKYT